jgi:hypothetical protein
MYRKGRPKFKLEAVQIIQQQEFSWLAFYMEEQVGYFRYIQVKGKVWLSECAINDGYTRKGLGSKMIQKAIEKYGAVYFYSLERAALIAQGNGKYDSRYLTEEGLALVKSLIRKGIIPKEWHTIPDK